MGEPGVAGGGRGAVLRRPLGPACRWGRSPPPVQPAPLPGSVLQASPCLPTILSAALVHPPPQVNSQMGNMPLQLSLTLAALVLAILYTPTSAELDSPVLQARRQGPARLAPRLGDGGWVVVGWSGTEDPSRNLPVPNHGASCRHWLPITVRCRPSFRSGPGRRPRCPPAWRGATGSWRPRRSRSWPTRRGAGGQLGRTACFGGARVPSAQMHPWRVHISPHLPASTHPPTHPQDLVSQALGVTGRLVKRGWVVGGRLVGRGLDVLTLGQAGGRLAHMGEEVRSPTEALAGEPMFCGELGEGRDPALLPLPAPLLGACTDCRPRLAAPGCAPVWAPLAACLLRPRMRPAQARTLLLLLLRAASRRSQSPTHPAAPPSSHPATHPPAPTPAHAAIRLFYWTRMAYQDDAGLRTCKYVSAETGLPLFDLDQFEVGGSGWVGGSVGGWVGECQWVSASGWVGGQLEARSGGRLAPAALRRPSAALAHPSWQPACVSHARCRRLCLQQPPCQAGHQPPRDRHAHGAWLERAPRGAGLQVGWGQPGPGPGPGPGAGPGPGVGGWVGGWVEGALLAWSCVPASSGQCRALHGSHACSASSNRVSVASLCPGAPPPWRRRWPAAFPRPSPSLALPHFNAGAPPRWETRRPTSRHSAAAPLTCPSAFLISSKMQGHRLPGKRDDRPQGLVREAPAGAALRRPPREVPRGCAWGVLPAGHARARRLRLRRRPRAARDGAHCSLPPAAHARLPPVHRRRCCCATRPHGNHPASAHHAQASTAPGCRAASTAGCWTGCERSTTSRRARCASGSRARASLGAGLSRPVVHEWLPAAAPPSWLGASQ